MNYKSYIVGFIAIFLMFTSVILSFDDVGAAEDSNWNNANGVEKEYVYRGYDAGVWVSAPGASYRDSTISVPYGTQSVNVQIRGSWYTRGYGYTETRTHDLKAVSGGISGISGGDFSRGTASNPWGSGTFVYNPSGYKTAVLNIGSTCSGRAGQIVTLDVVLRNTFSFKKAGTGWIQGGASDDTTKVTIKCGEPPWTVNGKSYVTSASNYTAQPNSTFKDGNITVFPGAYIYFKHDLRAQKDIYSNISWILRRGGAQYAGWPSEIRKGNVNRPTNNSLFVRLGNISDASGYSPNYTVYRATTDDIGKDICQRIEWVPAAYNNSSSTATSYRCAKVRSDFNLYPKATINGSELGTLSYGSSVDASNISEVINNTGSSADKDRSNNDWAVYQFKVPSSSRQAFLNARATIFNQSDNGYKFALGAYTGATTGCAWLKDRVSYVNCLDTTAAGSQKFLDSSTSLPDTKGIDSASFDVGDLVCRIVTVKDYNHKHNDANERRISYPACVTIAKTPWVQIWGGDVRVGSAIGTNSGVIGGNNSAKISTLSTTQENLYGSWGEYGMVAPTNGTISSASAGAFSGATGGSVGSNRALLSFANTASVPGRWANYTTAKIPNFGTATQTLPASTSSINVGSYPAGTTNIVRVQGSNVLNLSGTLQAGTTLIVNTSRTVTITGNITYARQTIGSAREASQLVVAAQNINIAEAVTEVNGWLIATPTSSTAQGVVSTCGSPASPYYTGLRSTNCDKKLTINGAITARQLQLRRTAGAEKDNLAAPAEVINQRADIFLWASSFATRSGLEMETAATMEAAPRF